MTLGERLSEYRIKRNLNNIELASLTGVDKSTISKILRGGNYSNLTADRIKHTLGDGFKEYVNYSTCPYCGNEYVPASKITASCGDKECRRLRKCENAKVYSGKLKAGEIVPVKGKARRRPVYIYNTNAAGPLKAGPAEPVQSIADFMNGRQYGDAQRELLLMKQKEQRMRV